MILEHHDGRAVYDALCAQLSPRDTRKVGNNTRLYKDKDCVLGHYQDCVRLRLHSTDIVTVYEDGTIVLQSGGWRTKTTADRINGFLCHFAPSISVGTSGKRGDCGWYLRVWHADTLVMRKRAVRAPSVEREVLTLMGTPLCWVEPGRVLRYDLREEHGAYELQSFGSGLQIRPNGAVRALVSERRAS